jgi:hypothetical protein
MKKQSLFIISIIIFLGLVFGIYQYFQAFEINNVSAVTVGVPNPGHTWAEIECNADTLCVDTVNKRLGIGTNNPTEALEVVGNLKITGNLLMNGQMFSMLPANGVCGSKNGKYASSTPSGTQACATGTITGMTGSYSWTCAGINGGTNSGTCATVATPTYAVVSFTTVGTTTWTVPAGVTSVEYLVVGGGGGGGHGAYLGGGGGGGAFRTAQDYAVSGNVTVVVGDGGVGGVTSSVYPTNGGQSQFGGIVAAGGGSGACYYYPSLSAGDGGSGGGGSYEYSTGGLRLNVLYGNNGGNGYAGAPANGAGGGGGAWTAGANGSSGRGGSGGAGLSSSITGSVVYYAGGGGGGGQTALYGTGGVGGGGNAAWVGVAGTSNTGGGGGGGNDGGKGGSGIVVIKYINNN